MNLSWIDRLVDWRVLLRWSWMARAVLLGVCLLLVPTLAYGVHGQGLLDAIARATVRGGELQQQWLARSAQVESLSAHQARIARLESDLRHRRDELFDDDGLASLLQSLARLGGGLSFEQVAALDPQWRANHVELPLQLQVLGEYRALKRFVSGLHGLGKLVTLHELQLTPADEHAPGVLRLQLRLQAYRALQMGTVAAPVTSSAVAPRNPFESLEAGHDDVAWEQARMVGHLRDRHGQVALVLLDGQVHLLREGDRFGGGQVGLVEEGRVELLGAAEGGVGIARVLTLGKG